MQNTCCLDIAAPVALLLIAPTIPWPLQALLVLPFVQLTEVLVQVFEIATLPAYR